MYESSLDLHRIFIFLFALYILVDRVYIRNFVPENKRIHFYKKSKYPMLFISFVIVLTGITLLFFTGFYFQVVLKIMLALTLIGSFFYCPFFMKEEEHALKRLMYRYFVVVVLVGTLYLGFSL